MISASPNGSSMTTLIRLLSEHSEGRMSMKFRATIQLSGKTATGIPVPAEVVGSLGPSKRPAVQVTINGYTYRSTVATMGGPVIAPGQRGGPRARRCRCGRRGGGRNRTRHRAARGRRASGLRGRPGAGCGRPSAPSRSLSYSDERRRSWEPIVEAQERFGDAGGAYCQRHWHAARGPKSRWVIIVWIPVIAGLPACDHCPAAFWQPT